ncbi:UTP--glucose-1-phosphate uridylyltransferase GalU [Ornithinibacillus sp. BX22]|uniref:UTP--glucose-1-phosphate uridylyltransferase n=2 Tax=Ornithinibacillus TaxID=484508 RepID=A0A923L3G2_9BACI|nr:MULTISPECIES: UTP--glucose-1-phosphate uridylyltransferase GalU [Ornithinibacillus]MBC5635716.1 UTP--glucose-1-phosphate uridylyltransferase GalU [Ornithinibacillus hominis]MBS3679327.1 UTP--glucose-1-phosphate uridylyltransferase GalU [Ornithinibacillus massiliensis]
MKTVKKAIIPAAGLGTRFLPATKAMPKEMLPIVDKPTIQYIVEEAIESGIEDIIIVTGKGKRAIEDHFDNNFELEDNLMNKGKFGLLEKVKQPSEVDIHYIRQKEPKGLGHAVWCARKFIGNEPFAVLLGDDIVQAETPALRQLIQQFEIIESSIVGVQQVSDSETHRYGIVDPNTIEGRRYQVNNFVEKPAPGNAPSNLAIMGRYVFTPEIFDYLDRQQIGTGGEIQLTDAIQMLNEVQKVYAYDFDGKRYDVGEKLGFLTTNIEFGLQNENIREELIAYLVEKISNLTVKG